MQKYRVKYLTLFLAFSFLIVFSSPVVGSEQTLSPKEFAGKITGSWLRIQARSVSMIAETLKAVAEGDCSEVVVKLSQISAGELAGAKVPGLDIAWSVALANEYDAYGAFYEAVEALVKDVGVDKVVCSHMKDAAQRFNEHPDEIDTIMEEELSSAADKSKTKLASTLKKVKKDQKSSTAEGKEGIKPSRAKNIPLERKMIDTNPGEKLRIRPGYYKVDELVSHKTPIQLVGKSPETTTIVMEKLYEDHPKSGFIFKRGSCREH